MIINAAMFLLGAFCGVVITLVVVLAGDSKKYDEDHIGRRNFPRGGGE